MRRLLLGGAMACALGLTAAAAQNPTTPPPPRNPASPDPAHTRTQALVVTVEGCVMREADVAGRNAGQHSDSAGDYILTRTKMIKGAAPASPAQAAPGETPTGTSGTGAMYQVKGIDHEKLKPLVGHRVQVEGTFEDIDRAQAPSDKKTSADDLVEIRGTSIRQVAGECPAK